VLAGIGVGKIRGGRDDGGGDPEVSNACARPDRARTGLRHGGPTRPACRALPALAVGAASVERFATEIRHRAHRGSEVQSPSAEARAASSAMPPSGTHIRKHGLARVVIWVATVGPRMHLARAGHLPLERRASSSDAFLALDYMLDRFTWLVDGLIVDPDRMRANLDSSHGLVFSQRVLLSLVESVLSRDEAYWLVQRNALRAWDEGLDLRALLEQDPELTLPPEALDGAFDLDDALKHVDVVFDRLSALMTRKEEPVHA
jgi:adenylosuccinate lyase